MIDDFWRHWSFLNKSKTGLEIKSFHYAGVRSGLFGIINFFFFFWAQWKCKDIFLMRGDDIPAGLLLQILMD